MTTNEVFKNDIAQKILYNEQKIKELIDPSTFILQPEVQKLMEENARLRSICEHEFDENGICVICGKTK